MENQASNESYRGLSDKRVNKIVNTLKDLPYTIPLHSSMAL